MSVSKKTSCQRSSSPVNSWLLQQGPVKQRVTRSGCIKPVLPVLVYGSETWTITKTLARRLDAFETLSLRKILWIPYTKHVTNGSVRKTTGCPPVSSIIKTRQLHFFGHVARSDSRQDRHRAISVSLRLPRDWRRPRGCPHNTWLMGLMLLYSWLTSVSTQPGGRPTIVYSGNISLTWQQSIRGMPLKKKYSNLTILATTGEQVLTPLTLSLLILTLTLQS